MPLVSRSVQASRPLDHVYDPLYTVSGNGTGARPQLYRSSRPEVKAMKEVMCAPTTIRGTERYKFYKKPIKPFVQQYPPGVMLAPPTASVRENTQAERQMREIHGTSEIYSVGCQTMYRESEVQTDPYTPDYYIKPGQDGQIIEPEILNLEHLSYTNGTLPAGLEEVKALERAIEKREFLKNLPPLTDAQSYIDRRRALEKQELKDWRYREALLKGMQDERLQMIIKELKEREQEIADEEWCRMERLKDLQADQRETEDEKLNLKRITLLRKLHNRERAFQDLVQKDIIDRYANFGSQTYAPIKRFGGPKPSFIETWTPVPNMEVIQNIENSAIPMEPVIEVPGLIVAPKFKTREGVKIAKQIERMDYIFTNHLSVLCPDDTNRKLKGIKRRAKFTNPAIANQVVRPKTPRVDAIADYTGVVLLQRLLRGRAAQISLVQGLAQQFELVRELQRLDGHLVSDDKAPYVLPKKRQNNEKMVNKSAAMMVFGPVIANCLEKWNKE